MSDFYMNRMQDKLNDERAAKAIAAGRWPEGPGSVRLGALENAPPPVPPAPELGRMDQCLCHLVQISGMLDRAGARIAVLGDRLLGALPQEAYGVTRRDCTGEVEEVLAQIEVIFQLIEKIDHGLARLETL